MLSHHIPMHFSFTGFLLPSRGSSKLIPWTKRILPCLDPQIRNEARPSHLNIERPFCSEAKQKNNVILERMRDYNSGSFRSLVHFWLWFHLQVQACKSKTCKVLKRLCSSQPVQNIPTHKRIKRNPPWICMNTERHTLSHQEHHFESLKNHQQNWK